MSEQVGAPKDVALRRLRVLLAEDQALVAMTFEDMLVDLGCVVIGPYARVATALEAARTEPLDGAVLDINLAGERSFPIAYQLRTRQVPFFFLTGLDHSILPAALKGAPCLTKPVRSKDFDELVKQLFLPVI